MRGQQMRIGIAFAGVLMCAHAQWLNYPTPGTPRTRDGKPNLSAPSPRASRLIVILYEVDNTRRQIYTDGRKLPADPQPMWLGYSVGRWEGDTLVVDTAGFNDKGRLDGFGHPRSEALRIQERFHRRDFGHMDLQLTIEDPKMFLQPITVKARELLLPDSDVLESFCNENEKDRLHMPSQ